MNSQAASPDSANPPIDDAQSPRGGVSVIFFNDEVHQEGLVRSAQGVFAARQTPFEFICVRTSGPRITPLSGSQLVSVADYQSAVGKAKYEQIVFADSAYRFEAEHWQVICSDSVNKSPIRSLSLAAPKPPSSRSVMAWLFGFFAWMLLGVTKHRLRVGLIATSKSFLEQLELWRVAQDSPDAPMEILALAHWSADRQKAPSEEAVECQINVQPGIAWTKEGSGPPNFPRSKSLRKSITRLVQFWFLHLAFPATPAQFAVQHGATRGTATPVASRWKWGLSAIVVAVACVLLLTNSNHPLFEPDETRNAQLALNVLETGNWTSLNLYDQAYTDKPPLLAWLTACSYWLLGSTEAAARFPSTLSAIATVCMTLLIGWRIVGFRSALAGTAALVASWGFVFQGRFANMDALLSMCTTLAILAGLLTLRQTDRKAKQLSLAVAGIATGLGIMAKGPVALVIVAPILALTVFAQPQLPRKHRKYLFLSWLLPTLAVGLPWFIVATMRNPEFAYEFLWKHHVVRFSEAFVHKEPFWYFGAVLWIIMFPASILLPRVFQFFVSSRSTFRNHRTAEHGILGLGALWIVGFFSLSECKLPAYVLPAFPMLALLCGVVVDHWLFTIGLTNKQKRRSFHRLPKRIAIGMSVLIAIMAGIIFTRFAESQFDWMFTSLLGAAVVGFLAVATRRSAKPVTAWTAAVGICFVFVFVVNNQFVASLGQQRSILGGLQQSTTDADVPVIYFGRDSFANSIYLPQHNVIHVREENLSAMKTTVDGFDHAIVVASDENMLRLEEAGQGTFVVKPFGVRHTFGVSHQAMRTSAQRSIKR